MDKNVNQNNQGAVNAAEAGRWVPVDKNSLGFGVPPLPNGQPVQGPDGALYCMGNSPSQLSPMAGNANNAVPTPPSIVQMPPIVQPIALVPYTSQNQPLLQYDPYSRPVDPPPAPKAPVYKRKPYSGISIAAAILAIAAAVLFLLLTVLKYNETAVRTEVYNASGIALIAAIISVFSGSGEGYYDTVIANISGNATTAQIFAYAIPFIALIVVIGFVCIAVKYVVKLAKGKSPRCFSVAALINFVLITLIAVCALVFSNSEVAESAVSDNVAGFFFSGDPATVMLGVGWLIAWICALVLFVLPFFAKKNAYVLADTPSSETYNIE